MDESKTLIVSTPQIRKFHFERSNNLEISISGRYFVECSYSTVNIILLNVLHELYL